MMMPNAGAYWQAPDNVANGGVFTYSSSAEDTVEISLIHLDNTGTMFAHHYPSLIMGEDSSFRIDVSIDISAPMLAFDGDGDGVFDVTYYSGGGVVDVYDDHQIVPTEFYLFSVPNPFNPQTTISFDLPGEMPVNLSVYDVRGRLVDVLIDDEIAGAGRNEIVWRGRDRRGRELPSGTYFYRLEAGGFSETKRMTLLK